ncbi:hypothetical protein BDK51DRAFT_34706 [Blyttiomyces helicus]|uniref:Uncharacterized protein n=1 Tax=Blyttiomyces helicus TaxID=388810 RepID=A0A4P9WAW6_9FUNG|nr:hypothetical protein BDK51DRAFT_34706 [Blyttiomyces helicus]|eukprot:RKO87396.1 hypothetical protein BDK51DRAFT_34706 [Blyttiomyces helicus]
MQIISFLAIAMLATAAAASPIATVVPKGQKCVGTSATVCDADLDCTFNLLGPIVAGEGICTEKSRATGRSSELGHFLKSGGRRAKPPNHDFTRRDRVMRGGKREGTKAKAVDGGEWGGGGKETGENLKR